MGTPENPPNDQRLDGFFQDKTHLTQLLYGGHYSYQDNWNPSIC